MKGSTTMFTPYGWTEVVTDYIQVVAYYDKPMNYIGSLRKIDSRGMCACCKRRWKSPDFLPNDPTYIVKTTHGRKMICDECKQRITRAAKQTQAAAPVEIKQAEISFSQQERGGATSDLRSGDRTRD